MADHNTGIKQRHGCVTAWLILMIVLNAFTALGYVVFTDTIRLSLPGAPDWIFIIYAFIAIVNLICAITLMRWKKIGFWGFAATGTSAFVLNLVLHVSVILSLFGLVGILLLYAILQIRQDNQSAWQNLE